VRPTGCTTPVIAAAMRFACALLAEQGVPLAIISAEGGTFDIITGRCSGNVPHMDLWRKGHSGDPLKVDRKGCPPEYVRRPALTLGLMIQPEVLDTIAATVRSGVAVPRAHPLRVPGVEGGSAQKSRRRQSSPRFRRAPRSPQKAIQVIEDLVEPSCRC
jgi:uncharacterized protein DUF3987